MVYLAIKNPGAPEGAPGFSHSGNPESVLHPGSVVLDNDLRELGGMILRFHRQFGCRA
ncbi:hypothetical protein MNBD_GAMMA14-1, partial [hydrothermal vent metagenome]